MEVARSSLARGWGATAVLSGCRLPSATLMPSPFSITTFPFTGPDTGATQERRSECAYVGDGCWSHGSPGRHQELLGGELKEGGQFCERDI